MKTEHISSPKNESSAQLESKAARSVNASQMHFSPYKNSTGVKAQERHHTHEEIELEFKYD